MDDKFLESIQGPSRFLGNEINVVAKDPESASVRVVLTFPDVYDLGMSHLGFKIIYHALNAAPEVACERAFVPEPPLERRLRDEGRGLRSLETDRSLAEFDVIGISLPHEMAATNVLTLLNLGGVELMAADRGEDQPIVLAGGPAAFSTEPLADFLDVVLLGDGEEGAVEIVTAIGRDRAKGRDRKTILKSLARLPGVYVPSLYRAEYDGPRFSGIKALDGAPKTVTKRTLARLDESEFPIAPLVAYGKPVHDRLSIELARGCTRGCRFCQAGMIYRPVRERDPRRIYEDTLASLKRTGYDEMSLLSLSAGDYSCLLPLLTSLMARLAPERVSVSLPSLRVDTLSRQAADLIKTVRATGFTLAPEAGSARLRAVINKNITEEEIVEATRVARQAGWRQLKLYFMIGLPTETEEDLEAMVDLVRTILREAPGMAVSVALSPFVPKPHTPFQWDAQLTADEAWERIDLLKKMFRRVKGVRVKWNSPAVSRLEGLLSRGDRRLSRVILAAWRAGARMEAWSEHFEWRYWEDALAEEGLELDDYMAAQAIDAPLVWDHLGVVDRDYLLSERKAALAAEQTGDCRTVGCLGCGVCDFEEVEPRLMTGKTVADPPPVHIAADIRKMAVHYRKLGPARLFGHLEMASLLQRAFRRAGIRLAYSQGYHPQPRLSFFEALPVGFESLDEYAQVEVLDERSPDRLSAALDAQMPSGLNIQVMEELNRKIRPTGALYRVSLAEGENVDAAAVNAALEAFMALEEAPFERQRPKKVQRFDIRGPVTSLKMVYPGEIEVSIAQPKQGATPRPDEVIGFALKMDPAGLRVLKLKTLFN